MGTGRRRDEDGLTALITALGGFGGRRTTSGKKQGDGGRMNPDWREGVCE